MKRPVTFLDYAYTPRKGWVKGAGVLLFVACCVAFDGCRHGDPTPTYSIITLLVIVLGITYIKWCRYNNGRAAE
jgi:hypothetical protein